MLCVADAITLTPFMENLMEGLLVLIGHVYLAILDALGIQG